MTSTDGLKQLFTAAIFAMLIFARSTVADEWPGREWATNTPAAAGLDQALMQKARDFAMSGGGAGCIIRGGKLVLAWGDQKARYDLKSTTKSFGATALGVAILDGKVALEDTAKSHYPGLGTPPESNSRTGWLGRITILQLATQTAGFDKPGGFEPLIFEPGTKWAYSDGGPNWLADCLTLIYRRDVAELMFERIFTPLGINRADLAWRENSYRPNRIDGIPRREFGSGISANVDAMARVGLLYLRGGLWRGRRLLPSGFVAQAGTTVRAVVGLPEVNPKEYGNASDHYGLLWWNNADGTLDGVPRDAFWSWGLYDSLIVVIPSLDIVVARAGQSWKRPTPGHYDVLRPFLGPIAASAGKTTTRLGERPNRGPAADDDLPIQQDVNAVPRRAEMPRVVARHHQRVVRGGPQDRIRP